MTMGFQSQLQGQRLRLAILVLVVGPAFLCYGYNQAVLGGVLTLEPFVTTFPQMDTITTHGSQRSKNSNIQGAVVSLYLIGGMFGSLACIQAGDKFGRRPIILLATVVSIIGAVLMASSFSLAQLIVARLVVGLGTGGYVATVPVWASELSKPAQRGSSVVITGIFISSGIALALWVDFGFYFLRSAGSVSWRAPLALQILMSLVVAGSVLSLPESPRWLIMKKRLDEASRVLALVEEVDPESPLVSSIIAKTQESLRSSGTISFWNTFRSGKERLLHRTMLAVWAQVFQQICGVNAVAFYATIIFQIYLGMDPVRSRVLAAAMSTFQCIGGGLSYFTIENFGRRKLMLISSSGMAVLMAILAVTTSMQSHQSALIFAIIALFLYLFMFAWGFAGLTFLYATEVAPLQYRAAINALSTAAIWASNFLIAQITPVGFDALGYQYYVVFASINAAIFPTVYFLFPETRGLSLEEIDHVFLETEGLWNTVKTSQGFQKVSRCSAGEQAYCSDPRAGQAP